MNTPEKTELRRSAARGARHDRFRDIDSAPCSLSSRHRCRLQLRQCIKRAFTLATFNEIS